MRSFDIDDVRIFRSALIAFSKALDDRERARRRNTRLGPWSSVQLWALRRHCGLPAVFNDDGAALVAPRGQMECLREEHCARAL